MFSVLCLGIAAVQLLLAVMSCGGGWSAPHYMLSAVMMAPVGGLLAAIGLSIDAMKRERPRSSAATWILTIILVGEIAVLAMG